LPTIALMTDFGIRDGNVGVMKGVIWGICPDAQIADVSHLVGPQDVREAALILARSAPYFPTGTIQLVVVDPGVGTTRRPMAAQMGDAYFVGPDNGVITLWLRQARALGQHAAFVHLDRPAFWLQTVSRVFHGRDLFAPAAAHLACGVPLSDLGSALDDPVELSFPEPHLSHDRWEGEVIYVDHFGNVASNIMAEDLGVALDRRRLIDVEIHDTRIKGMVDAFGDRDAGDLIALLGSTGNLIVSVVNGSASSKLGARLGDPVIAYVGAAMEARRQGSIK